MRYDLYFHNDFDGRASGAVMLFFLKARGDEIQKYIPVDFGIKPRWPMMKFENPAIIVDFIYHPQAAWWFDHHATSFIRDDWKKKFRKTKFHSWDPLYPSCTSLVLDSLVKNFGFKPPRRLKELSHWLDVVDSAGYRRAEQTIMMKEAALQIDAFIDNRANKKEPLAWLIEFLSQRPLTEAARDPRIKKGVAAVRKRRSASLAFHRKNLQIFDHIGVIDLSRSNVEELRYVSYYLYPKLVYNITLKRGSRGLHLTVGVNPWRRRASRTHIGKLLMRYGGGGHEYVGGVEIENREKAQRAIKEIIEFLKK